MSDFTVTNLKQVDDAAVSFGLSPQLEARFGRTPLGAERSGVSYQRLAPNTRAPFGHRHAQQEEIYVIVGGGGRVKVGDEIREVGRWDAIRVAPTAIRAFESGPDGLELLAFGAGEAGEAEILDGWWSDDD